MRQCILKYGKLQKQRFLHCTDVSGNIPQGQVGSSMKSQCSDQTCWFCFVKANWGGSVGDNARFHFMMKNFHLKQEQHPSNAARDRLARDHSLSENLPSLEKIPSIRSLDHKICLPQHTLNCQVREIFDRPSRLTIIRFNKSTPLSSIRITSQR